jgi:predicted ribosomally synthesized peptide with SipW-like signal peptide
MKIRKSVIAFGFVILAAGALIGVAYASFTDQSKFAGSRFTVGSADLKLLNDLAGGTDALNLVDTKPAPSYDNIYTGWLDNYPIKIYNNGSQSVTLTSNMDYLTANDPMDIREVLYIEPYDWDDANNNGLFDGESEQGISWGRKAFTAWKSTGFNFGQLASGTTKSLIMRFSTGSITNSKMGAVGTFDFMFDAVGQ